MGLPMSLFTAFLGFAFGLGVFMFTQERLEQGQHQHQQQHQRQPKRNVYFTDTCVICLEKFSDKMALLSCGHSFHDECIKRTQNKRCPVCRTTI